jgi:hypothetical protein
MPTDGRIELKGAEKLLSVLNRIRVGIEDDSVLREIGEYLVFSIKNRTEEGKDINQKRFTPYSPAYRFFRSKKGLPTNIVDLTLTGSMLNSLTYDVGHDKVKVFFMPGTDKSGASNPAKAFYLQQDREFFGYTDKDAEKILELYNINIGNAVRGRK